MNLSDELQALARSAPPSADPDVIVRLARARRARRLAGGSALLVLVVALPLWLWADGRGQEPGSVFMRLTFTVEGPPRSVEPTRRILQERAEAMKFVAPQAIAIDDRTIAVEAGVPAGIPTDWLATPGRLQIRKVLRAIQIQQGPSSPTGTPSSPATGGTTAPARTLEELKARLGGAYDAAVALTAPAKSADGFAAFAALTPAEVALLPTTVQFHVPTIACGQLDNRPNALPTENEAVVCGEGGFEKYLLGGAPVTGEDIAAAIASPTPYGDYMVSLRMTDNGGPKWVWLAREAFHNTGGECEPGGVGDEGRCRLAMVIDGKTFSAPQIVAEVVSPGFVGDGRLETIQWLVAVIGPRELPPGVTLTPR